MMVRLLLAWRNLLRNSRRTLVNISMIVSGFTAIVIFNGFGENVLKNIRKAFISVQYGHIQVGTNISWDGQNVDDANERLIENPQKIIDETRQMADFTAVTARLGFFAMLSSDIESMSAHGIGYSPSQEPGMRDIMVMLEGRALQSDDVHEVALGYGLMKSLKAKVGDQLTVLAQTVDGSINAIEVVVSGSTATGVGEIDNFTFYMPLKVAQKLLDTSRAERLVYFFDMGRENVEAEAARLNTTLPKDLHAKTWRELATLYRQTESYFGKQNLVISFIIVILVMLSISNTISNSIIERTGEIGTVRAMGDRRSDVVLQFLLEGLILAAFGGVIAIGVGIMTSTAITAANIHLPLPGTSMPVDIGIEIIPQAYFQAFLLTTSTAILATLYPAWRVSRFAIVDALKRNI